MKRAWFFLLLLVSAAWAEPDRITFWHALGGEREAHLRELVGGFQRQNPDIAVELRRCADPRGVNDYHELYRQLLQSLGEGHPPTIAQMYENWVTQLAEVKQLVSLDDQLGTVWHDMPPVFLRSSTHSDRHRYSVPFNKSLWVLYANTALTGRGEPPQNWSELREACAGQAARPCLGVLTPFELFSMHFLSQGGQFFAAPGQPAFAGPVGMRSGDYVQQLYADGILKLGAGAYGEFADGKLPYLIDTSAKLAQLEHSLGDRLRVLPLPRGAGDRIQLTGTQLSLFAKASPRERRAALRLLRYLSAPEQTRTWAMATGYLPVRQSVFDDPVFTEYLRARAGRAVIASSLSRAQVQPQVVGWEATRVIVNDALERVLFQKRALDVQLREAQATTARLLKGLQGKG